MIRELLKAVFTITVIATAAGCGGGGGSSGGGDNFQTCEPDNAPGGFDDVYERYLNCNGIPVVATAGVDDEALIVANETMDFMLLGNDDIKSRIIDRDHYYILFGKGFKINSLPEFSDINPRFAGYSTSFATTSSGLEMLCQIEELLDDPLYQGPDAFNFDSNNFVHEFAHVIHLVGHGSDSSLDSQISDAYSSARNQGLWNNTYAAENYIEYFAELTTIWFEVGRKKGPVAGDGTRNHITTRDQLQAYDPGGFALISSVFNTSLDVPGCVQRNTINPYLDPDLSCPDSVTDIQGGSYPVTRIGNQCWMASNLATGRFRSGAPIAEVTNNTDWSTTTAPAAAFYDNDPANLASRGILYNHAAALSPEGICPAGMRLPSIDDMRQLSRFIDPKTERAEAPLLSATVEWAIGSDAFGFNARPSGRRNAGGSFEGLDVMDYRWLIWSSDNDPADASMGRSYTIIDGFDDDLVAASEDKRSGLSIRCLSD